MYACGASDSLLRLERVSDDDIRRCEDFIDTMRVLYKSTLAVSSEKSSTAGQILPILAKLKDKFKVEDDDSAFKRAIKQTIWADLSPRYTVRSSFIIFCSLLIIIHLCLCCHLIIQMSNAIKM